MADEDREREEGAPVDRERENQERRDERERREEFDRRHMRWYA